MRNATGARTLRATPFQGAAAHVSATRIAVPCGSTTRLRSNLQLGARLGRFEGRAGEICSTNPKSTSNGGTGEERKKSEKQGGKNRPRGGKPPASTPVSFCDAVRLLKACASRQEKPSICCKNGAAHRARSGDPHAIFLIESAHKKISSPVPIPFFPRR